ncbi:hypothetical protein HPB51_020775 [Rhipicephalus microplus]|uniref:Uncharacterized protein n=1 Tax=Rhipicephalus microplus TaxID=6941 RepID=A0A9J6DQ20_RHIMP|nr:hypothetical protein HPB51_020775 [Rhipicephalus microplus]
MEREQETRVDLPVVRVNRGGLYVIVAVLGIVIIASLSVTGQQGRPTNQNPGASRGAGGESPPAVAAVTSKAPPEAYDILEASCHLSSSHLGFGTYDDDDDDEPSALLALAHKGGSAKNRAAGSSSVLSQQFKAVVPGLKPATPVKNRRTFVVQSINGTLVVIARQQGRPTNQNPGASRSAGGESPPAVAAVTSKAPPEAYDILEASVSWNKTHSK